MLYLEEVMRQIEQYLREGEALTRGNLIINRTTDLMFKLIGIERMEKEKEVE